MNERIAGVWQRFSLAQQYMLASFVVLLCCMIVVGWWISREIENGVVQETATTTALYMNSFVAPLVQELGAQETLSEGTIAGLDALIHETPLGKQVVSFKLWSRDGRVIFSADPALIGEKFPLSEGALRAWGGSVSSGVSELDAEEHVSELRFGDRLLETYSPIRRQDSDEIIAVAEFYQIVDNLQAQLARTRLLGWIILGIATLGVYATLAGIVRRGSDTIVRQQRELRLKVRQLTSLLAQNRQLSERVRRAATAATARNENFLRRISAELHDGPAQALGLALLRLDTVIAHSNACPCDVQTLQQANQDLDMIQGSLREALEEIRKLSTGLTLPELEELGVGDTISRVVRAHEQRTDTKVRVDCGELPDDASLPVKIGLYRVIQEALSNAYRHAGGEGQSVRVGREGSMLCIEVGDRGPGFDPDRSPIRDGHLGVEGMRQRVESMGGAFRIESAPGRGTTVYAELPLRPSYGDHDE